MWNYTSQPYKNDFRVTQQTGLLSVQSFQKINCQSKYVYIKITAMFHILFGGDIVYIIKFLV